MLGRDLPTTVPHTLMKISGLLVYFMFFCSRESPRNLKDLWFLRPLTEGVCKVPEKKNLSLNSNVLKNICIIDNAHVLPGSQVDSACADGG